MLSFLKSVLRATVGGWHHRRTHSRLLATMPTVHGAIQSLEERWPQTVSEASKEQPIFLLASSWRAGSTALQRLVVSSGQALIWGEPYRDCNYIQLLAASLQALSNTHPTDRELHILDEDGDLDRQWIGTLSPDPREFKKSHRMFVEGLYCEPSKRRGYPRWGFKEVRLGKEHVEYLRWLFPNSRFVFLHRNPYSAYRSYRVFETWYGRWPSEPILSARDFALHWRRLTEDFLSMSSWDDCMNITYDDLSQKPDEVARHLSAHLDLELDGAPLKRRVTGRVSGESAAPSLPRIPLPEMWALRHVVGSLAESLGYGGED